MLHGNPNSFRCGMGLPSGKIRQRDGELIAFPTVENAFSSENTSNCIHDTIKASVTDGKNFSILCSPTIVTNVVDLSDVKTGDSVIIREYYRRRDD